MMDVKNRFGRYVPLLLLLLLMAGIPALAETVAEAPAPTSVKLGDSKTVRLAIGANLELTPTLSPENAVTTYRWKSSGNSVATVSGGVVTAKKVGSATITCTTANGRKASVVVKVYDPYLPTAVRLDRTGTVRVPLGTVLELNATLAPETAQSALKWSTSSKKIATVSGGVVTPKKTGTATITVTTRNKKKARVKVKVYDPYLPSSVKLNVSGTQTLMVMNKLQLEAALSPETAQSAIKWKSSNKKVATVSATGEVSGIKPGTATITATTRNKKTARIKVKVIDDGKQPITTLPDYNLPYVIYACKNSHTIAIIARDESGAWTRVVRTFPTGTGRNNSTDVGTFFLVKKERWHKWGSGYSPYANRVSVGIYLHGPIYKSKNHNTIRPSYYNCIGTNCSSGCLRTTCGCSGWIYYNCPVGTQIIVAQNSRFSAPRPKKISKSAKKDPTDPGSNFEILMTGFTVSPGALTLARGASQAVTPGDITPAATTTKGFTYVSRDPAVATVSSEGIVTGVGAGATEIVVTAKDDFKCSAVVPVTVDDGAATPAEAAEAVPEAMAAEGESFEAAQEEALAQAETPAEEAGEAEDAFFVDETESVTEDLSELPAEEE